MKSNLVRAALVCVALAMTSTAAMAAIDPIPGVDIIVKKNPGGHLVIQAQTSPTGQVQFKDLAPGDYVIEIDGPSLVAAIDKLTPPAPAKKSSSSSFSLGIGGSFGGGSSRSNEGKGPVGGGRNSGRIGGVAVDPNDPSGNRVNRGGSSSGGVGLGVGVPIGGGHDTGAPTVLDGAQLQLSMGRDGGSGGFSLSQGYCRDAAGQGMSIGFSVPERGNMSSSDDATHSGGYVGLGIKF